MKISVIVPCYNLGKYVFGMLESIKHIDDKNIEFIVIDDKSTDNTLEYIETFDNNKNVRIIKHKDNKGISETRNSGIRHAKGEYIYFLDGDDKINIKFKEIIKMNLTDNVYKFSKTKRKSMSLMQNFLSSLQVSWFLIKVSFLKKYNLHFEEGIIFEDNHFGASLHYAIVESGMKKIKIFNMQAYDYTNIRQGSITSKSYPFELIKEVIKTYNALDIKNKDIKDIYKFQLINSFISHCEKNKKGFVVEKDKTKVKEYLIKEFNKTKIRFWKMPALWKIRWILIKTIKRTI